MTVYRSKSKVGVGFAIYAYSGNDDPLTDPANHLSELLLHSSFDYYPCAAGFPQDVTVSHAAVAADGGTTVVNTTGVTIIGYNSVVETDYTLTAHSLGYVPNFRASVNGVQYPAGCPIQIGANGSRRCVSLWADASNVYVRDSARPSKSGLPAISVTYHLAVFRDPAPIGSKLEDCQADRIRLAYGKFDTDESMVRAPDAGETTYAVPAGETMSITNGRPRFALPDGSVFDVGPVIGSAYNGNFFGGPSMKVAFS